jgi:cell division protein ZapD
MDRDAACNTSLGAECRIPDRRRPAVIRYEHPLNERIRTLMRLEDLYNRAVFFSAATEPADHHAALLVLFEISDVAARADLKTDILQELERQRQLLAPLRTNPAIERETLDALLAEIDAVGVQLLAQTGKVGAHLRENEWLMAIKQRTGIPGGVCEFDLPAYHYWLHLEAAARQQDLHGWLAPFLPIHAGLSIILRLLRENGRASRHTAYHGVFQLMLTTAKVAQLLRLSLAIDLPCVPEISANKYALNIRFLGIAGMDRGSVYDGDVEFDLMFCNL